MSKYIAILLLLFSGSAYADDTRDVPESLFGIKLGEIYDIGNPEANDLGNLPVKKFTGEMRFLGHVVHYYFQPLKEYKAFEYVEKREKPEDQYFESPFTLNLLPVIPASISTKEQLNDTKIDREVTQIRWSTKAKTAEEAYSWAINLCEVFETDITQKPEILDEKGEYWYECTFRFGVRKFEVTAFEGSRSIELSYQGHIFYKKDESLKKQLRKMEAEDIRPY
jgi:hypothetical protein